MKKHFEIYFTFALLLFALSSCSNWASGTAASDNNTITAVPTTSYYVLTDESQGSDNLSATIGLDLTDKDQIDPPAVFESCTKLMQDIQSMPAPQNWHNWSADRPTSINPQSSDSGALFSWFLMTTTDSTGKVAFVGIGIKIVLEYDGVTQNLFCMEPLEILADGSWQITQQEESLGTAQSTAVAHIDHSLNSAGTRLILTMTIHQ